MKASGKLQQPNPDSTLQKQEVWVISPGKNQNQLKGLLKAKGIQNKRWEKLVINISFDHVGDQF